MHARLAVILVVALSAPALAGCIQGTAESDRPSRSSTAGTRALPPVDGLVGLEAASAEATAWNAGARLFVAFATEGLPADPEDPPFLYDSSTDPAVGDGLAGAWTYLFSANDSKAVFAVAVRGGEDVTYARALDALPFGRHFGPVPAERPVPPDGVVTSAAAAGALAANATVQKWAEDHPVSVVRLFLVNDDKGPAWHVMRFTTSGFSLQVRVDALTGALTDLHRFPDDWFRDECPPDAGCVDPDPPMPPEEPPRPETRVMEKTVTLTPFDPSARMLIPFEEEPLWLVNVTVTAEVPGVDGAESRTITLHDMTGWRLDQDTGTGTLTVTAKDQRHEWWGGEYSVDVQPATPVVRDQEVTLTAVIEYGAFIGYATERWTDAFWGHVGFKQSEDHEFRVEDAVDRVTLRFQVEGGLGTPYGALTHPDVTFTLNGPNGDAGSVGGGGEIVLEGPGLGGLYTLTAESGDENLFGTSYQVVITQERSWEEPQRAHAVAEPAP